MHGYVCGDFRFCVSNKQSAAAAVGDAQLFSQMPIVRGGCVFFFLASLERQQSIY